MKRVAKIIVGVSALALLAIVFLFQSRHDFIITQVHYLRGNRISEEVVCIGISGHQISYIGKDRVRARTTIAGDGLILAPGFIDVNSCGWLTEEAAMLKLEDGVTTFLNAHGDSFRADAQKFRVSERLNYATSVGLIPVQAEKLKGKKMMAVLEDSLRYGAYTISLSPEYNSETTSEIITELARHFAGTKVLFTFHLRYSSEAEELEGLKEAIACAEFGNPVHILHITSTGATFHPEEAKDMIEEAIQKGMKITFDFYPYTSWGSSIHRARFQGNWRERYRVDFSQVRIAGELDLTPDRFEELMHSPGDRNVIVDSIPQETVDLFALNTTCPIGTDSEANPKTTHPRGAGSFTKFVNDYVDTGKVSFGKAIHRFSTATAQMFAPFIPDLKKRGTIEVGYAADLVLWDRAKIRSNADFDHPLEASSGVVAVFVNGVPQILDGKPVKGSPSSGRHLKGVWAK